MSREPDFLPEFFDDVVNERSWYDDREPGSGAKFVSEVYQTDGRIVEFPLAAPDVHKGVRKRRVNKLRHLVIYRADEIRLVIIGVMHSAQQSESWIRRRLGISIRSFPTHCTNTLPHA